MQFFETKNISFAQPEFQQGCQIWSQYQNNHVMESQDFADLGHRLTINTHAFRFAVWCKILHAFKKSCNLSVSQNMPVNGNISEKKPVLRLFEVYVFPFSVIWAKSPVTRNRIEWHTKVRGFFVICERCVTPFLTVATFCSSVATENCLKKQHFAYSSIRTVRQPKYPLLKAPCEKITEYCQADYIIFTHRCALVDGHLIY